MPPAEPPPEQSQLFRARAPAQWLALTQVLDAAGSTPCAVGDPQAWWPEGKRLTATTERAIEGCSRCRAREACLDYAMAADERYGIWGGTLPQARRAMRWAKN